MTIKKIILLLGIAGMLFAGYLSLVRFFAETCAFGESCPYFLGYPACYYGFAMFTVIAVLAFLWNLDKVKRTTGEVLIAIISFAGIMFAGYFTLRELPVIFQKGFGAYVLGLPTCALGLIFYIAIFAISLTSFMKNKKNYEKSANT